MIRYEFTELGWETEDWGETYYFQVGFDLYGLYDFEFDRGIPNTYKITKGNDILFYGVIENKSHLQKIMDVNNIAFKKPQNPAHPNIQQKITNFVK